MTSYTYSKMELTDVSEHLCFILSENITFSRVFTPLTTTMSIKALVDNKLSKLATFALTDVMGIDPNVEIGGSLFSSRVKGGASARATGPDFNGLALLCLEAPEMSDFMLEPRCAWLI